MSSYKYDIIALGELNVDLILNQIGGFPEIGKEKFAGRMDMTLGSSTAIFASNASALGMKVAFAGMTGADILGNLVRSSLVKGGVSVEYLIENKDVSTGITVCLSYSEDRANLTYQGAMDVMTFDDLDKGLFKNTSHIHISSVFMQSALMADLDKILSEARANGVTVSMDTQWDPSENWDFDYKSLLPEVDIFMPNEEEIKNITRKGSLDEAVAEIIPHLKNALVVKCGSRGSMLVTREGDKNFMPAFLNKNVVDTIGAGDSFNAGFIMGYVKGCSLVECQRLGSAAGAVSTTAAGGTGAFTDKDDIIRKAKSLGAVIDL